MTKSKRSTQNGVLKDETTASRRDMPSTNAASQSISATSGITASTRTASQLTPNSPPNADFRLLHAIAAKLGALVIWRRFALGDGRKGWALFFDDKLWQAKDGELWPR